MELTVPLLLTLAAVLLGAKAVAQASYWLGLPAVFGELLLGLLIGPSVLGWLSPSETFSLLADIGVILLMFLAGLETDLVVMRQVGKASVSAAIGGVLMPMLGGMAVATAFGMDWQHALFIGAILTATSVSISAQTLREMGRLRSREGATILGAAVIDDVLGVLVFALIISLCGGGAILLTLVKMAVFFPVAWLLGNRVLPILLRWEKSLYSREASLAVLFGIILLYAWTAEALGSVATITGAYLLGVLVARHTDTGHIAHGGIAAVGYAFFIPVFFVNIGLHASSAGMITAPWLTLILVATAVITKLIGAGVGAHLGGFAPRSALQVGCGMVSRGEVALVITGAGLSAGLINSTLFSISIIVALATTLVTPPLLRMAYAQGRRPGDRTLSLASAFGAPRWQDFVAENESHN